MKKLLLVSLLAATSMGMSTASFATTESKAAYAAAKDHANAEYKTSRAKCNTLSGNPKDVCIEEAKAARDKSKAAAKFEYKGTLNSFTSARKTSAEADYDVAKEKCDAKTGNEKDVCVKEAKSEKVAAIADAKTDKKVVNAFIAGQDDKMKAEYKVAIEKCDALSASAKDSCVASAKASFGK